MTLETLVARLLALGTAVACLLMTIGLLVGDPRVVVAGIATLIALPILRVAVLVVAFAVRRDVRFAATGLAVLAIIGVGVVLIA